MPELMLNRVRDRPPTPRETVNALQRLFPRGSAMAAWDHDGHPCAAVVAFVNADDQYAANLLSGEQSECEWWQRDHVLAGLAIATSEPDASWEALACAQRGHLARANVTVWFERPGPFNKFIGRYRFFPRSERIAALGFRPSASELTTEELQTIIARAR